MFCKVRIIKALNGLIALSVCTLPANAQENLGTSFGIPENSPAVSWPHGLSTEALGGLDRLYPNGPEFGLSNTSGGFGMIGSGRMSGVGLAQASLPNFVRLDFENPHSYTRQLTGVFSSEAARSSVLLGTVLGGRYRAEIEREWSGPKSVTKEMEAIPISMPSVDSVLKDQPANQNSILNTSL